MIIRDSQEAKDQPVIVEFVQLVRTTVGDGVLDFSHLQTRPFMPFWKSFSIVEYLQNEDDFRSLMCGSELANAYGRDQTGKRISELEFGEIEDEMRQLHFDALKGELVYASCTFGFQKRDYKKWHQVKMRITHNGRANETVAVLAFE